MSFLDRVLAGLTLAVGLSAVGSSRVGAQQVLAYSDRAPRFLAFVDGGVRPLDVRRSAVLNQRIELDLDGATIKQALGQVIARSGLRLVYRDSLLPAGAVVHLRASEITVAAALAAVLMDAGVDVAFDRSGAAVLVRRSADGRPPAGSIAGRVTDAKTGAALTGAAVAVEGTSRGATSGTDGRYRITEVAPGTYTVRARYIGYAPSSTSVTVTADQEATADLALEKSAQRLDEVVTTGTIVPTAVKALPTPVSIVTAQDIEQQHIRRFEEAIRLAVPGAVVWEPGGSASVEATLVSLRGTSGISTTSNPKFYIDGVEVSSPNESPVDPQSIERIEVVRGPQAAAIYGSDAMGGVIQIFTKRGTARQQRPELELSAALGRIESDFEGSGALRQEYDGAVHGRSGVASYRVGGGYTHTGAWLPNYSSSLPSANAGLRLELGRFVVDLSARYYQQRTEQANSPAVTAAWPDAFPAGPRYEPLHFREETYALQLEYRPTTWWRHGLTAGIDRISSSDIQSRPRLLTPADTFLTFQVASIPKLSVAYHTSATARMGSGLSADITTGVDHRSYTFDDTYATALNTSGFIQVVPGSEFIEHDRTTNTGLFGQVQLAFRDALFLTGSARADWNSEFGQDIGVPISPRVGLTYTHNVGSTSIKARIAYGEAIRAPIPGSRSGSATSFGIVRPNPLLKPERQTGPDMGVDIAFGRVGSLSVTYYRQIARDLLETVNLDLAATLPVTQWQNVARVRNKGWEFEGSLLLGPATISGQYAVISSEAEDLGPSYTGTISVGEQITGVPRHTGAATLVLAPRRNTAVTAALAFTGARRDTDFLAAFACYGGTGPCSDPTGAYLVDLPSFTIINVAIEQQLSRAVSAYIGGENVTNAAGPRAFITLIPVPGRITTVGARVRY